VAVEDLGYVRANGCFRLLLSLIGGHSTWTLDLDQTSIPGVAYSCRRSVHSPQMNYLGLTVAAAHSSLFSDPGITSYPHPMESLRQLLKPWSMRMA
jgi:hypothetical protein